MSLNQDYPKLAVKQGTKVTNTKQAAKIAREIADQHVEFLAVISVNDAALVTGARIVSIGGQREALAPICGVFRGAISDGATGIVLVHNHPNGMVEPSKGDRKTTKRMIKSGNILQINVLDSIIVSGKKYRSIMHHKGE